MEIPSYDPGVAANVFSCLAVLIATLSYRLSRKNALAAEDAKRPDVHIATITALPNHPGWISVLMKITNHLPSALEVSEVRLKWPLRAIGITEPAALVITKDYSQGLPPVLPADKATRRLKIVRMLGPSGTGRIGLQSDPGGTEWIMIYVRAERSAFAHNLRFSVSFSLRKSDVRRFKRIVSNQRIELPRKQAP